MYYCECGKLETKMGEAWERSYLLVTIGYFLVNVEKEQGLVKISPCEMKMNR